MTREPSHCPVCGAIDRPDHVRMFRTIRAQCVELDYGRWAYVPEDATIEIHRKPGSALAWAAACARVEGQRGLYEVTPVIGWSPDLMVHDEHIY